jgi:SAM-dependent methyltransferase
MDAYRTDLAYIHDAGHGWFAEAAANVLLNLLRGRRRRGLIVELGCGSGIMTERLSQAGHSVLGIDISPAMIAIARQRAPKAAFKVGSFLDLEIPPCMAVTSIGECFNYLFDESNSRRALAGLFRRSHAALEPRGLLLFDVAGPGRVPPPGTRMHFREGEDWAVGVVTKEVGRRLNKRITSFRQVGGAYRRDFEEHRLRLYRPAEMMSTLRRAGFSVRQLAGYGELRFGPGHAAFLARKA